MPGKIDAPLGEKLQAVKWGEYRLGDLFDVLSYKQRFDANKVTLVENGGHPYIVRQGSDNGQKGFIDEDEIYLNDGNTISFGQDTATMFYQEKPYFTGDKIKILKPKMERFGKDNAQFFLATMRRSFSNFGWGTSSFSIEVIENQNITLPTTTNNEIDFDFMESFIRELEEERIRELQSYLAVTGLSDYTLTKAEQDALSGFDALEWQEFRMGDLYDKVELNNKKFDKRNDTRSEPSECYSLPVVNAKHGDNGIMFWGSNDIFDSEEMTIDIVQNGAVATGDVYPQPQRTGVLWDAYLIKAINHIDTRLSLFFFATSIQKSIKLKFAYEFKATWDRVKDENIYLPVRDGMPDYEAMQDFISAVQKLVIKDVVKYADKKIGATKAVVNG